MDFCCDWSATLIVIPCKTAFVSANSGSDPTAAAETSVFIVPPNPIVVPIVRLCSTKDLRVDSGYSLSLNALDNFEIRRLGVAWLGVTKVDASRKEQARATRGREGFIVVSSKSRLLEANTLFEDRRII
jgi:hypothetical protein